MIIITADKILINTNSSEDEKRIRDTIKKYEIQLLSIQNELRLEMQKEKSQANNGESTD